MRRRNKIYPGDAVYCDEEGRLFTRGRQGRIYLGQWSLLNKNPIKEGRKVTFEKEVDRATK